MSAEGERAPRHDIAFFEQDYRAIALRNLIIEAVDSLELILLSAGEDVDALVRLADADSDMCRLGIEPIIPDDETVDQTDPVSVIEAFSSQFRAFYPTNQSVMHGERKIIEQTINWTNIVKESTDFYSGPTQIDALEPDSDNWLMRARIDQSDELAILGEDLHLQPLRRVDFDIIAQYLVEEIGLHDEEIVSFFASPAVGLGGASPLEIWLEDDGFARVYEYAQTWEDYAYLPDDNDRTIGAFHPVIEKHIMQAVGVFRTVMDMCGVECTVNNSINGRTQIWDGPDDYTTYMRWKGSGNQVEGLKIGIKTENGKQELNVVILNNPDGSEMLMQAGIAVEQPDGEHYIPCDVDSAPTRSDLAPFVSTLTSLAMRGELRPVSC